MSEIRGLSFKISNKYNNHLYKIFSSINVLDYDWDVSQDEIYIGKDNVKNLFSKQYLNGEEFQNAITSKEYYMVSANIKAYLNGKAKSDIIYYEDFLNSSCQLIMLCHDSIHVEFYCKDKNIIESLKLSCEKNLYQKIELITSQNDCRTIMSV